MSTIRRRKPKAGGFFSVKLLLIFLAVFPQTRNFFILSLLKTEVGVFHYLQEREPLGLPLAPVAKSDKDIEFQSYDMMPFVESVLSQSGAFR